jgi:hypothetical protein
MLTTYTILGATVLGVVAALLFGRKATLRRYWYGIGAGLMAVGLLVTVYGAGRLEHNWRHRNWPSVSGTVIESRVAGTRAFHPVVVYEYQVGEAVFRDSTALHQPSFGGKWKRYDVAVKAAAEYVPGMTVPVFYNPSRPGESVLKVSVYWADYGITGVGAMLLAIGVCLTLLMIRGSPGAKTAKSGSELASR